MHAARLFLPVCTLLLESIGLFAVSLRHVPDATGNISRVVETCGKDEVSVPQEY